MDNGASSSRNRRLLKRSGAIYTRRNAPRAICSMRASISPWLIEELMNVAGIPLLTRPSTWSFISAISGEITTVIPSRIIAGNW